MTDEARWNEVLAEAVDVLDRLHTLLAADELHDSWREDFDRAISDAAGVLDQVDQLSGTDQPADVQESGFRNPEPDEVGKRCPRCDTRRPVDEFGSNRSKHDGLQSYCRPCVRAMNRAGRPQGQPPTSDGVAGAASQARQARRLTAPTGQPPHEDEPGRQPAHAGSQQRAPATIEPLT